MSEAITGNAKPDQELRMEAILSALAEGVSVQDRNFKVIYQNPAHIRLHGHQVGEYCFKAYANVQQVCTGCPVARAFADGQIHTVERSRPTAVGMHYVEITASPLINAGGEVFASIEIVRDITEKKRADDELGMYRQGLEDLVEQKTRALEKIIGEQRHTESELRQALTKVDEERAKSEAVIAAIGDGISIQGTDLVILYENQVHRDYFGGDHTGEFCYQAYAQRESACADCPVEIAIESGGIHRLEKWIGEGEERRCFDITASPLRDAAGNIIAVIEVVRDTTEHRKLEEAIRSSQEYVTSVINNIGEGLLVINREFGITAANEAYCRSVDKQLPDVLGHKCHQISHNLAKPCHEDGEDCPVKHVFDTGNPHSAVHAHRDAMGRSVYVEVRSYPMRNAAGSIGSVIQLINDITEKRQLKEQLEHVQKMEAVGTLTGGIAHEFNNLLMAIMGYGHLLKANIEGKKPILTYVDHLLASTQRGASLTQALLTFSRKQVVNPMPVDVNRTITRMMHLLRGLLEEDIFLDVEAADEDLYINADAGQIDQVLINLATNARDAMPCGGTITIETGRVELDREQGYGRPGNYAFLSVADTGVGMDEAIRERIFEPFFTTKEVGKGTGLGLAMVYGIVKQHGGYIDCSSIIGKGTVFTIHLPLITTGPSEGSPYKPGRGQEFLLMGEDGGLRELKSRKPLARRQETLLIAEDDGELRALLSSLLREEGGYQVIESVDGQDAIDKFIAHGGPVHLLVLDMIMPRKNGNEACEAIKKLKPDIKVLFITGYAPDFIRGKGMGDEQVEIASKPIEPYHLLEKVRALLDAV
jgi:two-component system, cell cycle sensor histidine kinase and response regulator CckA